MTPEISSISELNYTLELATELNYFDILALASISSELSNNGASEITFTIHSNGQVIIFFTMPYEGNSYSAHFTVDMLKNYYNKSSLFIKEVVRFD